eukprot:scaffold69295_cov38-Phaeocystis_antarctica.AAC.2
MIYHTCHHVARIRTFRSPKLSAGAYTPRVSLSLCAVGETSYALGYLVNPPQPGPALGAL